MKKLFIVIILFIPLFVFSQETEVKTAEVEDTTKNIIIKWKLNSDNSLKPIKIDTSLYLFQIYNPVDQSCISNSFLGNLGLAYSPNIFYFQKNTKFDDFIFLTPFDAYAIFSNDVLYYNVRKPYTHLFYLMSTGQSDAQFLKVLHTQNVNKEFNFGIQYNTLSSKGEYLNQQSGNNALALWVSYIGNKYSIHANFTNNKFSESESGGTVFGENNIPRSLLKNAKSVLCNRGIQVVQEFIFGPKEKINPDSLKKDTLKLDTLKNKTNIGTKFNKKKKEAAKVIPLFTLSHKFEYIKNYRYYTDDETPAKLFYSNFYLDSAKTKDSIHLQIYRNTLQLRLFENENRKFPLGSSLGITIEIGEYYNFIKYISLENEKDFSNTSVSYSIYNQTSKSFILRADVNYFIDGYRKQDYNLKAEVTKFLKKANDSILISLTYEHERRTPGFFKSNYFSNHYRWIMPFEPQENKTLSLNFKNLKWNFNLTIAAQNVKNFIYFNETATPFQRTKEFHVYTVLLNKDFHWWHINSINKISYQYSTSKSVLNIPEFNILSSFYFDFNLLKKVMHVELGANVFYSSPYKIPAYSPALGLFYMNNSEKSFDHPVVDAFINLRIKTMLIFIKMDHVNSMGNDLPVYYSVYRYPYANSSLRFGFSWKFND